MTTTWFSGFLSGIIFALGMGFLIWFPYVPSKRRWRRRE